MVILHSKCTRPLTFENVFLAVKKGNEVFNTYGTIGSAPLLVPPPPPPFILFYYFLHIFSLFLLVRTGSQDTDNAKNFCLVKCFFSVFFALTVLILRLRHCA
jgi:hypothetical protein